MSLLHATWLFPLEGSPVPPGVPTRGRLLLWADTWRVAKAVQPAAEAPEHPLTLNWDDLATLLQDNDFWS